MIITPAQCRAARGLLGLTQDELAAQSNVSKRTIWRFEVGEVQPYDRTLKDIVAALEAKGVLLIPEQEGVHSATVALKWGVEPKLSLGKGKNAAAQEGGSLDALAWEWGEDGETPGAEALPPLDWSDEDRAAQLAMWCAAPERWAALHEVSRQCLLRAMGVDSLGAE
jgi:transcriptional regulator with XRE-family HTH domain